MIIPYLKYIGIVGIFFLVIFLILCFLTVIAPKDRTEEDKAQMQYMKEYYEKKGKKK